MVVSSLRYEWPRTGACHCPDPTGHELGAEKHFAHKGHPDLRGRTGMGGHFRAYGRREAAFYGACGGAFVVAGVLISNLNPRRKGKEKKSA